MSTEKRSVVLRAFAELAIHLQRLDTFPSLKAEFWKNIEGISILHTSYIIYLPMLLKPASPSFMVHVVVKARPAEGVSHDFLATLFAFLTVRHAVPIDQALDDDANDAALVSTVVCVCRTKLPCGHQTRHLRLLVLLLIFQFVELDLALCRIWWNGEALSY